LAPEGQDGLMLFLPAGAGTAPLMAWVGT